MFSLYSVSASAADAPQAIGTQEGRYSCPETFGSPARMSLLQAKTRSKCLLELQLGEVTEKLVSAHIDRQNMISVWGVPKRMKLLPSDAKRVYRHYSAKALPEILHEKVLKSGVRPYIDPTPHERREYLDLTGVMFTTPEFPPEELWMGVSAKTDWVEFTLTSDIPVWECSKGNLLIPAQEDFPDWMRTAYSSFVMTGKLPIGYSADKFLQLKQSGGMHERAGFPIQILRHQKDGVIQREL